MSLAPPSLKEQAKLKAENERIKTAERLAKIHRPEIGITALEFPLEITDVFHSKTLAEEDEEEIEINGKMYYIGQNTGTIYQYLGDFGNKGKIVGFAGKGEFKHVKPPLS